MKADLLICQQKQKALSPNQQTTFPHSYPVNEMMLPAAVFQVKIFEKKIFT